MKLFGIPVSISSMKAMRDVPIAVITPAICIVVARHFGLRIDGHHYFGGVLALIGGQFLVAIGLDPMVHGVRALGVIAIIIFFLSPVFNVIAIITSKFIFSIWSGIPPLL